MALQKWVLRPSVRRGHSCRELLARDGAGHVDIGAMADLLMNRLPGIAMADDGEATQLSFTIRDLVAGGWELDGNWHCHSGNTDTDAMLKMHENARNC